MFNFNIMVGKHIQRLGPVVGEVISLWTYLRTYVIKPLQSEMPHRWWCLGVLHLHVLSSQHTRTRVVHVSDRVSLLLPAVLSYFIVLLGDAPLSLGCVLVSKDALDRRLRSVGSSERSKSSARNLESLPSSCCNLLLLTEWHFEPVDFPEFLCNRNTRCQSRSTLFNLHWNSCVCHGWRLLPC